MKLAFIVYNIAHIDNWIKPLSNYLFDAEITVYNIAEMQCKEFPKNCNGIKNCDISQMSGSEIKKKLKAENPDACVFLNFRSMFELLMQRICKDLEIPDFYLEHGIFNSNNVSFSGSRKKNEISVTLQRQYVFVRKYIGFITCSKHPKQELEVWYNVFLKGKLGTSPYTRYFVYGERCKSKLSVLYGLNDYNTILMGYPLFHSKEEEQKLFSIPVSQRTGILYIHQPFIKDKYTSIGYDEEKDYLVRIAENLTQKYGNFTILLHPREDLKEYYKRFRETGIKVIQEPNNYNCFMDKRICIGHYSTALLFPLYFDIETYIIDYPNAVVQPIFEDFFPHVHDVTEIDDVHTHEKVLNKEYLLGKNHNYQQIAGLIQRTVENLH